MPLIIAQCVVRVPSLTGSYAPFGLTAPALITLAIDHINRGDIAFVNHPVYQQFGHTFSGYVIDLAVEILELLPAVLEDDFNQIGIIDINDNTAFVSLEIKD